MRSEKEVRELIRHLKIADKHHEGGIFPDSELWLGIAPPHVSMVIKTLEWVMEK